MNPLARTMIEGTRWESLHVAGSNASFVPDVLNNLVEAADDEAVDAAYWQLDNGIVVQGRVLDSALAVAPVLLALLCGELSSKVKVRILDLLFEIQGDQVHEEELARGNATVARDCTRIVQEGLWIYYSCLLSKDARVRKAAIDLIGQLDQDFNRRNHFLEWASYSDVDHDQGDHQEECEGTEDGEWKHGRDRFRARWFAWPERLFETFDSSRSE